MLYPTAGCRLFIFESDVTWTHDDELVHHFDGEGWVEIGELEALGILGGRWETAETEVVDDQDQNMILVAKTARRRMPMQVILGMDPADAGQQLLWRAYKEVRAHRFRLDLPEGAGRRFVSCLVTEISEVYDTANSVIRLQVEILPTCDTLVSDA